MLKRRMQMAMAAAIGLIFLMNTADSQALGRGQHWVRSHPFTINAINEGGYTVSEYRDVGFSSGCEYINQSNYDYTIDVMNESSHAGLGWHWMTGDSNYNWIRTTAQSFLNSFPNNLGFCIGDESNPSQFSQIAGVLNDIRALAPNSLVYHAALGIGAFNSTTEYVTYIDSVINTLQPDVLMYDQYPFYNNETVSSFYQNLSIVRDKAMAAGIPYWCWLQSHGRTDVPQQEPSESEMRLQAFAALAYGYTGLSYWTYASAYYPYSNAMLNSYGMPTAMFYSAKNLVPEVRRIGEITKSLTSTGVYFQPGSGYSNPTGTTLWSSLADSQLIGVTAVSGQGFIVGLFKDDQNEKYFMVVNANHAAGSDAASTAAKVSLQFAGSVTSLARLNRSTGRFEIVTPSQLVNYELPGGTGDLFKYNTAGLATYEFPTSFGTNPAGRWSLAYGAPGWSTANDLTSMVPHSAAPNWNRPGYSTPRVDGDLWVLSGNAEWPGNDAGVLVFQVPATGRYSINTHWYAYGAEGDPTTEYLSVRVAPDASSPAITLWSSSYSWTDGSGMVTTWNLADVSQLQSIDLKAGSYIFFSMNVQTQTYYPMAYNRFFKADGSLGGAITFEESPVAAIYSAPATFATNPQNQWSLAYGAQGWSTVNDLSAMAPRSAALNWGRPGYGAPRVDGDLWVLAGNAEWPGNDAGVLVFQAPIAGRYRIKTIWYGYGAEGDPTTEYLSVRVAQNASASAVTLWSTSYSWTAGSGMVTSWNLGNVAELQEVQLAAGAYVFFSMNVETKSYYPTAYNRFFCPPMVTLVQSTVPGDANSDGMVDVGDLGILAANYGGSGKTWAQGDFNGDKIVDVGDLGILAAHYGSNASNVDWSTDYAKAFGTIVSEEDGTADEENCSVCSGLGLPLVTGLLLVGLMLVKLEE